MRVALIVIAFALTLYALLDCARTPSDDMPARMPKAMWIMLIIASNVVGSIGWIIVSRVSAAERRGGTLQPTVWSSPDVTPLRFPQRPRTPAPDDDPEFLRSLDEQIHHRRPTDSTDPRSTNSADADPKSGTHSPEDPDSPEGESGQDSER